MTCDVLRKNGHMSPLLTKLFSQEEHIHFLHTHTNVVLHSRAAAAKRSTRRHSWACMRRFVYGLRRLPLATKPRASALLRQLPSLSCNTSPDAAASSLFASKSCVLRQLLLRDEVSLRSAAPSARRRRTCRRRGLLPPAAEGAAAAAAGRRRRGPLALLRRPGRCGATTGWLRRRDRRLLVLIASPPPRPRPPSPPRRRASSNRALARRCACGCSCFALMLYGTECSAHARRRHSRQSRSTGAPRAALSRDLRLLTILPLRLRFKSARRSPPFVCDARPDHTCLRCPAKVRAVTVVTVMAATWARTSLASAVWWRQRRTRHDVCVAWCRT